MKRIINTELDELVEALEKELHIDLTEPEQGTDGCDLELIEASEAFEELQATVDNHAYDILSEIDVLKRGLVALLNISIKQARVTIHQHEAISGIERSLNL